MTIYNSPKSPTIATIIEEFFSKDVYGCETEFVRVFGSNNGLDVILPGYKSMVSFKYLHHLVI